MNKRLQFLLSFWLVVVIDPYKGIDYENPQTYQVEQEFQSVIIKVYCAEGHNDCHNDVGDTSQEGTYEQEEIARVFCYLCTPPQ